MIVYGIKNCGTVKKAITWLNEHNLEFEFHDYKKQSITASRLQEWSRQLGWEALINRKGMTWRKLDEVQKEQIKDQNTAIEALLSNTSMIKRPIIEQDGKIVAVGFNEAEYADKLQK
ncbi:ArsC family reductase [Nafulsella turpanensis]|uniref:ArsC family reductase n=1 Tax=Nafulsella turpanensis TaxID=1265690 RepID=UPI0003616D99|nr:ArsC family reductase [Nafulsella turpanensis]